MALCHGGTGRAPKGGEAMFKKITGDWQNWKSLPGLMSVDLHFGKGNPANSVIIWQKWRELSGRP